MMNSTSYRNIYNKTKSVQVDENEGEEDCKIYLKVTIFNAEGIDNNSRIPKPKRFYKAVFWVCPEDEKETTIVRINPVWDREHYIELDNNIGHYEFLYLEVFRLCLPGDAPDPGTSTARKLVGRSKIRLPPLGQKVSGKFRLVLQDFDTLTNQGLINLQLEIIKVYCADD